MYFLSRNMFPDATFRAHFESRKQNRRSIRRLTASSQDHSGKDKGETVLHKYAYLHLDWLETAKVLMESKCFQESLQKSVHLEISDAPFGMTWCTHLR